MSLLTLLEYCDDCMIQTGRIDLTLCTLLDHVFGLDPEVIEDALSYRFSPKEIIDMVDSSLDLHIALGNVEIVVDEQFNPLYESPKILPAMNRYYDEQLNQLTE